MWKHGVAMMWRHRVAMMWRQGVAMMWRHEVKVCTQVHVSKIACFALGRGLCSSKGSRARRLLEKIVVCQSKRLMKSHS